MALAELLQSQKIAEDPNRLPTAEDIDLDTEPILNLFARLF